MNDRIVIDPRIQHGKPVIRGTRVPVARIVGGLAGGMTMAEVVDEYGVSNEDVRAALCYAAALVDDEPGLSALETAMLSEPALAVNWNTAEEDEAWSHLAQLPSL